MNLYEIQRYMFFSNVNYDYGMNLEYVIVKKWRRIASQNIQASNKMVSQMNVVTDYMTSQCNSYIYSCSFNVSNSRYYCRIKEKVVPFSCDTTFLSHGLNNAGITMEGFNTDVIKACLDQ